MGGGSQSGQRIKRFFRNKRNRYWLAVGAALLAVFWFSLPEPLFDDPTSTVLEDRQGRLLAARIAGDGQWRFPYNPSVPEKYEKAVMQFEDRYFFRHPGVNPFSLVRALKQNMEAGEIVSGGSTLTMQLIRLSRKGRPRNIYQKVVEMILAVRAELRYSKKEILALYASHAPFGGNVVGLDGAAWRYYGRSPDDLSWAETAALAVLPNAPSLIYPGKHQGQFTKKRNRLLDKLYRRGVIDQTTCELAKDEPLPETPRPLPGMAPHLMNHALNDGLQGRRVTTTIKRSLQQKMERIVDKHHRILEHNEIHNAAALVLDVETGNTLAYVGNTRDPANRHENRVDVITAPRSPGSILKPLLYAAMLGEGDILPHTLVSDIPTQISGYSPKNFDGEYAGAVPASVALYRSLNIPAVRMLQQYGLEKFYHKLQKLELSTLTQPASHYGLSLILGGSEVTLWEVTGIYAGMARTLSHFRDFDSGYNPRDYHHPRYREGSNNPTSMDERRENGLFAASAIWSTFEALTRLHRPRQERGWEVMGTSRKVAWKTGTSFGFRDGWAVAVTPRHAIGVWVGNADGEGRPGLTGVGAAAPILFDILRELPRKDWFVPPYDDMSRLAVCSRSGYRAGRHCPEADTVFVPEAGLKTDPCPYHRLVHLDQQGKYRVTADCIDVFDMQHRPWFVLPPVMEWYYRKNHQEYKPLPPFAAGCRAVDNPMEFIYPEAGARVFVPVDIDGEPGKVVFRVAHRQDNTSVYWHLNQTYLGTTKEMHEMALYPEPGKHTIHLVDENGNTLHASITVVED